MKAIVYHAYGSAEVLQLEEVPLPEPGPGEIQVKVKAASINPVDWKARSGDMKMVTGKRFPRFIGGDFSGEVSKLGSGATRFRVAEQVYGTVPVTDGKSGSYAQFLTVAESRCMAKPSNITHAEAAAVPIAGWTALQCLRTYGGLKSGGSVLILGASGGVGSYAVQAAKALGARVTAVCSGKNTKLVSGLGADLVVDYQTQDPLSLSERFDVVLDAVNSYGYSRSRKVLKPNGVYVTTSPGKAEMVLDLLTLVLFMPRCKWMFMKPVLQDMRDFDIWLAEGKVKSVLGKTFPLAQAKEATLFSESHHAAGKIILQID